MPRRILLGRHGPPLRLALEGHARFLTEMGRVYDSIRRSPVPLVLERAGAVGATYQPEFREALALAARIEPRLRVTWLSGGDVYVPARLVQQVGSVIPLRGTRRDVERASARPSAGGA